MMCIRLTIIPSDVSPKFKWNRAFSNMLKDVIWDLILLTLTQIYHVQMQRTWSPILYNQCILLLVTCDPTSRCWDMVDSLMLEILGWSHGLWYCLHSTYKVPVRWSLVYDSLHQKPCHLKFESVILSVKSTRTIPTQWRDDGPQTIPTQWWDDGHQTIPTQRRDDGPQTIPTQWWDDGPQTIPTQRWDDGHQNYPHTVAGWRSPDYPHTEVGWWSPDYPHTVAGWRSVVPRLSPHSGRMMVSGPQTIPTQWQDDSEWSPDYPHSGGMMVPRLFTHSGGMMVPRLSPYSGGMIVPRLSPHSGRMMVPRLSPHSGGMMVPRLSPHSGGMMGPRVSPYSGGILVPRLSDPSH